MREFDERLRLRRWWKRPKQLGRLVSLLFDSRRLTRCCSLSSSACSSCSRLVVGDVQHGQPGRVAKTRRDLPGFVACELDLSEIGASLDEVLWNFNGEVAREVERYDFGGALMQSDGDGDEVAGRQIDVGELAQLVELRIPLQTGIAGRLLRQEGEPAEVAVVVPADVLDFVHLNVASLLQKLLLDDQRPFVALQLARYVMLPRRLTIEVVVQVVLETRLFADQADNVGDGGVQRHGQNRKRGVGPKHAQEKRRAGVLLQQVAVLIQLAHPAPKFSSPGRLTAPRNQARPKPPPAPSGLFQLAGVPVPLVVVAGEDVGSPSAPASAAAR